MEGWDEDRDAPDRLRHMRRLREHVPGCCCWQCVTALEMWVVEMTREQREAYEAMMMRRVEMAEFTLQQQISAVKREIGMRENVYPRQVSTGKMKQSDAELHIAEMKAVLKTLEWMEKNRAVILVAVEKAKEKVPDAAMGSSK